MIRVANILMEGRFGGPQNRVLQVAARLEERDIHTTAILDTENSDVTAARMKEAGVSVVQIPLHRLTLQKVPLLGWFVFFLPEMIRLVMVLRREKVDIVHCNGIWQIKAVLAGWLARKKVVFHLNNTCGRPLQKTLFHFLGSCCDAFVFASNRTKSTYPKIKRFQSVLTEIIQAPVDVSRFSPEKTEPAEELSEKPGLAIVTVGNVNPDKGHEYFVEMAAIVLKTHPDVSFHIVGQLLDSQKAFIGKLRARIEQLPSQSVIFRGPSAKMSSTLGGADLFVLSSVLEASPMAVWEAMAMSLPIVSTDVGDVPVFIKNGLNGFVVPTRDPRALAEKVNALLDDAELRSRFGRRARETAVAELDIAICAARHERLYKTMMGQYNPSSSAT